MVMDKKTELKEIGQEVALCRKCSLFKTATNPVPGNGNPEAEIMLLGEAPGYWENQRGIPFCGAAGKLLDELLSSLGLSRDKVFVSNVLKHRPPENREPRPEEVTACQDFLDRQIKIIRPKIIITLGRFSMYKFLPLGKISRDHGKGRIVEYNGLRVIFIPMFHPAAALRGAEVEQMLREDFKRIPEEIKRLAEQPKVVEEEEKEEQLSLI